VTESYLGSRLFINVTHTSITKVRSASASLFAD